MMGARAKLTKSQIPFGRDKLDAVVQAIADLEYDDLSILSTGDDIGALSSNTHFDSIEASPETVFISDDGTKFEASGIVYVTLEYGGRRDNFSIPDSFPATIVGKIGENGAVKITDVKVDASSFYD